ncbi:hypothetical protein [Pannonibacter tanglangensis]|uniref:Uncharacterized protein n=1 Tax=Pannonibacter tanglangensis TaxID=2750084 RepID=A0ABW9ZC89_9HYPH|nr:hypothetical protein [Pannonibacter sp. XCT-34]NBN62064.1 hypothetical protein [Pannonibacter sp. XCT-34]
MKKITLTVENQLYGPAQYPAYADRGLCVYKLGRAWCVAHVASGMTVDDRARQPSKARACELMADLLALPLDWDRPWDELRSDFGALAGDVRGVTTRYRPT